MRIQAMLREMTVPFSRQGAVQSLVPLRLQSLTKEQFPSLGHLVVDIYQLKGGK